MKGKALLSLLLTVSVAMAQPKASRYFQLNVYSYSNQTQEQVLEQYLQNAFVPTAHALGFASVGVFKAIANDTAVVKKLYVLLAAKSAAALLQLPAKMLQHKPYTTQAATWLNHEQQQTAYDRKETILLQAFAMSEGLVMPNLTGPRSERVYELRSYESSTEALYRNKVHMFNEGDEIGLFKRLQFNAIFYGDVIAGSHMPNLMYMTSFNNMTDRQEHWKQFVADAQWKSLSSMPFYKGNVSHIDISFLRPTAYSDY